ncbi:hypothetical protein [Niabella drilacis]|uniref:Uncharacterized protein n=1 Tax=Niabella drilacis (strain DSM 25811 / CCM 8410 / CCUG 62505 / LMG 26954 / E90) TaxID=1285928 RepID=A0A1G6QE95_NIADE|nr:hypothetical protein [Niabella drilacis]SDC90501.1 hypothetical protein SAMN04487894_104374 [Niabella drilacis]
MAIRTQKKIIGSYSGNDRHSTGVLNASNKMRSPSLPAPAKITRYPIANKVAMSRRLQKPTGNIALLYNRQEQTIFVATGTA